MVKVTLLLDEAQKKHIDSNKLSLSKYVRQLIDNDIANGSNSTSITYSKIEPPQFVGGDDEPPAPPDLPEYEHKKVKNPPKSLTPEKKKEIDKLKAIAGGFSLKQTLETIDN